MANLDGRAQIVIEHYNNARTRGDFLESLLAVHTVIGDATKEYLKIDSDDEEGRKIPFNTLIKDAFEDYFKGHSIYNMQAIYDLNGKRNGIAHPRGVISSDEVYYVTTSYFKLLVELWPLLFSSALPIVRHPEGIINQRNLVQQIKNSKREISSLKDTITELEQTNQELRDQQQETGGKADRFRSQIHDSGGNIRDQIKSIPWRILFFGLAWLLLLSGLIGVSSALWSNPTGNPLWVLIPAVCSVLALYLAARQLIVFIRALRFRRVFAVLSTCIIVLTILLIPFAPSYLEWNEKAGYAFGSVIEQSVTWPIKIFAGTYAVGERLADAIIVAPSTDDIEQQVLSKPETEAEPGEQAVDSSSSENIRAGVPAEVVNIGSRLMCRESPGRTKEIVARLERGDIVYVISDAVEEGDMLWLKVQHGEDQCWCAEEYILIRAE